MYSIPGHGNLIEKTRKGDFERRIVAFAKQLEAHADGLRQEIDKQADQILQEALKLIVDRSTRAEKGKAPDRAAIKTALRTGLKKTTAGKPEVTYRYKDVTYEHTNNKEFAELVKSRVPALVMKRLGEAWFSQFDAAPQANGMAGRP